MPQNISSLAIATRVITPAALAPLTVVVLLLILVELAYAGLLRADLGNIYTICQSNYIAHGESTVQRSGPVRMSTALHHLVFRNGDCIFNERWGFLSHRLWAHLTLIITVAVVSFWFFYIVIARRISLGFMKPLYDIAREVEKTAGQQLPLGLRDDEVLADNPGDIVARVNRITRKIAAREAQLQMLNWELQEEITANTISRYNHIDNYMQSSASGIAALDKIVCKVDKVASFLTSNHDPEFSTKLGAVELNQLRAELMSSLNLLNTTSASVAKAVSGESDITPPQHRAAYLKPIVSMKHLKATLYSSLALSDQEAKRLEVHVEDDISHDAIIEIGKIAVLVNGLLRSMQDITISLVFDRVEESGQGRGIIKISNIPLNDPLIDLPGANGMLGDAKDSRKRSLMLMLRTLSSSTFEFDGPVVDGRCSVGGVFSYAYIREEANTAKKDSATIVFISGTGCLSDESKEFFMALRSMGYQVVKATICELADLQADNRFHLVIDWLNGAPEWSSVDHFINARTLDISSITITMDPADIMRDRQHVSLFFNKLSHHNQVITGKDYELQKLLYFIHDVPNESAA